MTFFSNMKIGTKLLALFLIIGIVPIVISAWQNYGQTSNALENDIKDKLEAIMTIKKKQVEGWYEERFSDIEVLATLYEVQDATQKFSDAWAEGGDKGEGYRAAQEYFSPVFDGYKAKYGYYDFFLISKEGIVVYTAEHERDFGTSLVNGQYRSTGLAKAFRGAMSGQVTLTDFESYSPSNGDAASFIAAPVVQGGYVIGVVALQMPISAINSIMQEKAGMGESGESYLVGKDFLMRSDSRFEKESTILKKQVRTKGVETALSGSSGVAVYEDYRGIDVWGAYSKLDIDGVDWVVISEMDDEEVMAPLGSIRNAILVSVFIIAGIIAFIAVMVSRSISRPISKMAVAAQELATGDIDQVIEVTSRDEIGELGEAFQKMIESQKELVSVADNLSQGNVKVNINQRSAKDVLSIAMAKTRDEISQLIEEMNHMASEHNAGDIDVKVDAARFSGAFNVMAQGVNDMVDGHIAVKKKAMACIAEFAKGNFDAPLEKFPGKKAFINDNIETLRENLKALIADAGKLVDAAIGGELSYRADASKHDGDFKKIVDGVNSTLDAVLDPINEAAVVLEALAERDLTARVKGDYKGEHAKIKESLNNTGEALHDALNQVSEAVQQVTSASTQISSSSQAVAEGASEQASSLEETSSSLEEMSGMTKQNAQNAHEANSMINTTKGSAENGGKSMGKMMQAMSQIRESAEGTAAIIKDINEIAFQTNLLALNAAVEAARAGEAGRGFAVVAEEVRNLALRSKEAAKKTEDLINESVSLAGNGESISTEVNGNLTEIVESVNKVASVISEIATASEEQSRGIEQINKAVSEMDRVTQQNAANSEESASASEELSSQAEELSGMVGRFKIQRSNYSMKQIASSSKPKKKVKVAEKKDKDVDVAKGIQLNPNDVIPMDDDEDFKDF